MTATPERPPASGARAWPRKVATGLATALLALLLAELILRVAAWGTGASLTVEPLPRADLPPVVCAVDDQLLELCPDAGDDHDRVRPLRFAAEPTRPRVTVVGESFVHGYSLPLGAAWPARLAAHLDDRAEVLNFGRCGSFAGQLVAVVDAALAVHTDVLVIAAGNNEHTMTTYYRGWAGRHPLAVYRLSAALGRLAVYGALYRVVGGDARLQERYAVPRVARSDSPLDERIEAARRRPPDLDAFDQRLAGEAVTRALEREQRLKERVFRGHLDEMLARAERAGVPVVLCTLPMNRVHRPVLSGVHRGDEAAIRDALRALDEPDLSADERLARADAGLALDDRVARLHHARGLALLDLGRTEEAVDALREAASWELVPDGTPEIDAVVRDVARDRGARLVDLERAFEREPAVPDTRFRDRVHVSAEGADEVGRLVAEGVGPLIGE